MTIESFVFSVMVFVTFVVTLYGAFCISERISRDWVRYVFLAVSILWVTFITAKAIELLAEVERVDAIPTVRVIIVPNDNG